MVRRLAVDDPEASDQLCPSQGQARGFEAERGSQGMGRQDILGKQAPDVVVLGKIFDAVVCHVFQCCGLEEDEGPVRVVAC